MARNSKLTPETAARIINALKAGGTQRAAFTSAGVGESTFYGWLQRGEREKSGRHREFSESVKKAEQDAVITNVTLIQRAAQGGEVIERVTVRRPDGSEVTTEKKTIPQWTAAAWWLERKFPDDWGRRERIDHRTPDGPLVNQNFIIIEDRVDGRVINRNRLPAPPEKDDDEE